MTRLELLAPAKNLECGMAAIDHGADAVYIGAPAFGARAAAGNSVADIKTLCDHAHRFLAKVYATVNTIIYEHEMGKVRQLIVDLCQAGVDAILVQDMCLVDMVREVSQAQGRHVEIHASTQTDNRTADKVRWLAKAGFHRVVLARELSAEEIGAIHREVPAMPLEAFVHGALCVSYSGVCYASQHAMGRSANRGECAQLCRLKFELMDADGHLIDRPRHWLSLRDMCRIEHLGLLAEAGVTSFKIEGRLKDVTYVKNVVAAYSEALNKMIAHASGRYQRSSLGRTTLTFRPDLKKTFNRGFTPYFVDGNHSPIASPDTPKALGEYVGKVKEVRRDSFTIAGTSVFANGDGLCFFDHDQQLRGFRANRVVNNRIYPQAMPPQLRPGMGLYRNADAVMDRVLSKPSAVRKIPITLSMTATGTGYALCAAIPAAGIRTRVEVKSEMQEARQPQGDNIRQQLSKLGTTAYEMTSLQMDEMLSQHFIPSSVLAQLRRLAVAELDREIQAIADTCNKDASNHADKRDTPNAFPKEYHRYTYLYNVSNSQARQFYASQGVNDVGEAFELGHWKESGHQAPLLMQCRHCIRRLLGACTREHGSTKKWKEPLYLRMADGRRMRLHFDCQQCQMNVYAEN
jgi:putative protease